MKAIILARVSTEEQKEAGNSLPAQQERLRSYVLRKPELKLDKEYIFDESAYKEHRKEFDKVIEYIVSQKEVVALCCDKVDRLSRDFLVGLPILEKLRREGKIELHFPSDNLVLKQDSPATDLFHFNIAVSLAQYYSNSISDNVKRSFEKMRRDGRWLGKPCLGYMKATDKDGNNTFIPDPERAHIIIKMFELYSTGNYSLETLRLEVIKMGLRSPIRGLKPSRSCIDNVIKTTFYYGMAFSKKHGLYPHQYEKLITKELFDKCQEVMSKKRTNRPKFIGQEFIFKGLLRCQKCGCTMTPEIHKKKSGLVFVYYSCSNGKRICKREYISEKALLEPIWAILESFSGIPEEAQTELVEELRVSTEAEVVFHKAQINRIHNEHTKLKEKDDYLLEAFLDKRITKDIYDKKHQEYYDKIQLLNIELEEHNKADYDYQTTVATVFSIARRAKEIFNGSEPSEKRAFLNFLLQNPQVSGKTLEFSLRSPFNLVLELSSRPLRGGYRELNPN